MFVPIASAMTAAHRDSPAVASVHYETFGTFQLIIANYKRLCLHPRVYQDKSVAVYKTMARTVAILPVSIHKAFFM